MSAVATVAINVDARDATGQLRQLQTQSNLTERAFGSLASALATIGVGIGLSKVLSDVKELDTNLRRLATVGGDVAQLDKALGDLSERLGGVASKAELAAASYQAASAGFSDTAGNVRILEAATKAAVGGLASAEGVTEVLVKTLNAYGMAGTDAYKVTDSISKAVEVGNQEWSDYVSQLGRVASISALAGVSLDEVNAFIASATKNGATAEIAFTGLGAALNTLLQPTKESQEAAKALGIEWNLQGLSAKGFTGLMAELAKKQDTNKESVARLLGSQEAMRGVFAANAKQGKDFANILGQLADATGKTDSDFKTMKDSLENQLKALNTAFANLSEALGKAFGASVVDSIKGVTGAVDTFAKVINAIPKPLATATAELVKLLAEMLLVKKAIEGIIALRMAFVAAMTSMATTTTAAGAAATASSSAFALYTGNTKALQAASLAAAGSVTGLHAALLRLAGLGIITVGVNYVVTQSGQIFGSSSAAGASEASSTAAALQGKYGKMSANDRAAQLKAIKANLANDKKLATQLEHQIRLQESTAMSSMDMPVPADRSRLTEVQARIRANQAKVKFLQTAPITAAQAGIKVGQTVGSTAPAAAAAAAGGSKAGGGKGKTDAEKAAEKAAEVAKKAKEEEDRIKGILRSRAAEVEIFDLRFQIESKINKAEKDGDKMLAARLRGAQKELDLQYQYAQLLADPQNKDARVQEQIAYQGRIEILSNQVLVERELEDIQKRRNQDQMDGLKAAIEKQYQLNTAVQQQLQLADGISNAIGQGMTSALKLLVSGTESWGDSLRTIASGILTDIANQLIRIYVIEQAVNAIKSFLTPFSPATPIGAGGGMVGKFGTLGPNYGIPQRAMGGPVTAGQSYVVGERGPELFTPSSGGMITPNNRAGGSGVAVTVNVDAKGTSVEGSDQQANQLGRVIAAAVQAELINQKRRGGLLNS